MTRLGVLRAVTSEESRSSFCSCFLGPRGRALPLLQASQRLCASRVFLVDERCPGAPVASRELL